MERLTEREKEILSYLQADPMITQDELASRLNISRSSAAVHISNLMRKKAILGRGYVFNERASVLILGEVFNWIEGQVADTLEVISEPAVKGSVAITLGGSGISIAERLSVMKVPVLLISALGMDEAGEQVLTVLRRTGVDTRHVIRSGAYNTSRVMRVVGSPDRKVVLEIHDLEGLQLLNTDLLVEKESLFQGARAVFLSSCLPAESINHCLKLGRDRDISLFLTAGVDIKPLQSLTSFEGLDYLILGSGHLADITGNKINGEDSIAKGVQALRNRGADNVAVLDAQEGVFLFFSEETVRLPLLPGRGSISQSIIYNLTAGLIYGVINGYSMRQSARIGMGALSTPRTG